MRSSTPTLYKKRNTLSNDSICGRAVKLAKWILPKVLNKEVANGSRPNTDDSYTLPVATPRTPSVKQSSCRDMDLSTSMRGSTRTRRSSYSAAYLLLSARGSNTPREIIAPKSEMENVLPPMILDTTLQRARSRILGWLLASVSATDVQISSYTFYLAASLYDKYLLSKLANGARAATLKQELEVLAMTSLFVASKMEDCEPLHIEDIFNIFRNIPIKKNRILEFERSLLSEVDFVVHNTFADLVDKVTDGSGGDLWLCMRLMSQLLILNGLSISVNQSVLAEEALRFIFSILSGSLFEYDETHLLVDHLCIATLGTFMKYRVDKKESGVKDCFEICWRVNQDAYTILKPRWIEFTILQQSLKKQRSIKYLVNKLARCNAWK